MEEKGILTQELKQKMIFDILQTERRNAKSQEKTDKKMAEEIAEKIVKYSKTV